MKKIVAIALLASTGLMFSSDGRKSYCPMPNSSQCRWGTTTLLAGAATAYAGRQVSQGESTHLTKAGLAVGTVVTAVAAVKWFGARQRSLDV